jgi:GNAT superfamily N-acetyltransferase
MLTEADLYQRGTETLIASWQAYARCATGASVRRYPGVTAAVFPCEPERGIYNNAVVERTLGPDARAGALAAMQAAYAGAGVERFAAWVHETDSATQCDLERLGYTLDTTTRAMGMPLDDIRLPQPQLELRPLEWSDYVRVFDLPAGLLAGGDHDNLQVTVAWVEGAPVASALTFDFGGDCGIYNVGTLEHMRRRGLATALTAHLLHAARARGCDSASLQSTPMAERVYAAAGFRDLGRFFEYVPARLVLTSRAQWTSGFASARQTALALPSLPSGADRL